MGTLCTVCNHETDKSSELNVSYVSGGYGKRYTASQSSKKATKQIIITETKPAKNNIITQPSITTTQPYTSRTTLSEQNLQFVDKNNKNTNGNIEVLDTIKPVKAQNNNFSIEKADLKPQLKSQKQNFKLVVNYSKDQKLDCNDVFFIERLSQPFKTIKVTDKVVPQDKKLKFNTIQNQGDIEKYINEKIEEAKDKGGNIDEVLDQLSWAGKIKPKGVKTEKTDKK